MPGGWWFAMIAVALAALPLAGFAFGWWFGRFLAEPDPDPVVP